MALVVDAAREAAEAALRDYWYPDKFPVDVEAIAEKMGLQVEYTSLRPGVSGMLRVRPDEDPTIYIDATENPARQRFTLAHELGHFVERSNLGQTDFAFIDERGMEYDLHEFYADEFAGNLLMPAPEIADLRVRRYSNVEMAAHFGVSVPAINKRIERLRKTDELDFG